MAGAPCIVELHETVKELKDGPSTTSSHGDKRPPEQPKRCIPYPHKDARFVYLDTRCLSRGLLTPLLRLSTQNTHRITQYRTRTPLTTNTYSSSLGIRRTRASPCPLQISRLPFSSSPPFFLLDSLKPTRCPSMPTPGTRSKIITFSSSRPLSSVPR